MKYMHQYKGSKEFTSSTYHQGSSRAEVIFKAFLNVFEEIIFKIIRFILVALSTSIWNGSYKNGGRCVKELEYSLSKFDGKTK